MDVLEQTLDHLKRASQARQRNRSWGDVVVRIRWEDGRIKLVTLTEEVILRPPPEASSVKSS